MSKPPVVPDVLTVQGIHRHAEWWALEAEREGIIPLRAQHLRQVARLLGRIADRLEKGEQLNLVPVLDIWYTLRGHMSVSEVERLALMALRDDVEGMPRGSLATFPTALFEGDRLKEACSGKEAD